jgi:hypothetical protein
MSPFRDKYVIDEEDKYNEYLADVIENKKIYNEYDLSKYLNLSEEQSKILRTWILMTRVNFYDEGYEDGVQDFKNKIKKLFEV